MTSHIWWYVARSTGIVAWLVLAASTIWGILQATQFFGRAVSATWLVDLHRFLGGLSLACTAAHLGTTRPLSVAPRVAWPYACREFCGIS